MSTHDHVFTIDHSQMLEASQLSVNGWPTKHGGYVQGTIILFWKRKEILTHGPRQMNPVDIFLSGQRQVACDSVKELEPAVMAQGRRGKRRAGFSGGNSSVCGMKAQCL